MGSIVNGAQRTARPTFCNHMCLKCLAMRLRITPMKTRCFDHIDLRVTDMETAKILPKFLPQLGFVHEKPGRYHTFYSTGGDKPSEFFGFTRDKKHKPNRTRIAFWATRAKKWIGLRNSCATLAGKTLKGRKFARTTARVTTPFFSKTPMATNSKFAAARSRYLRADVDSEIRTPSSTPAAERRAEDCAPTLAFTRD